MNTRTTRDHVQKTHSHPITPVSELEAKTTPTSANYAFNVSTISLSKIEENQSWSRYTADLGSDEILDHRESGVVRQHPVQ